MATLVLNTVGTLIGGPIGGAIGALIGQQIDRNILFAPKGRQGPRLGELAVQTSSYGTPIPRLFGTMRVAGTVIWATDLREERRRSGGKGQPRTTTYSYSANFAVVLSARPILGVRRIWADGKLLRGAGGDFKTVTGFRLYRGDEAQTLDPLIASVEGNDGAPASRGLAYAVFEDFQLAEYGNRIPSLTFEVEADATSVPISTIAEVLSEGAVRGSMTHALSGYAAAGDSMRGAIETLARATPLSLRDNGEHLELSAGNETALTMSRAELGAGVDTELALRRDESRGSALAAPAEIALSYYEPARDFQAGLQRALRPGGGRRAERIELPAALDAGAAKAIAEANLARGWTERIRQTVRLPWRHIGIVPSQIVSIEGEPGLWRVAEASLERMTVVLSLVRHRSDSMPAGLPAEPGRPLPQPDLVHGPTLLQCFELPELGEGLATTPSLFAAAAGASPGWRRAALAVSHDGGASWQDAGSTAASAIMGTATAALGDGSPYCFDDIATVEVELFNDTMQLSDADDARLAAGTNLALLGGELIQFGRAEPLAPRRYRLSHLLRGRRGTEYAIGAHVAYEGFVLIEAEALTPVEIRASTLGVEVLVMATGVGDVTAVEHGTVIAGLSIRPPSPVAFRAEPDGVGGYHLRWIRRSRLGWRWIDSIDAPLGEESELYRVVIMRGEEVRRVLESAIPELTYPAVMVAADASGADALTLSLVQVGSLAPSMPTLLTVIPD